MLKGCIFLYNTIAPELLQRLEFVQKMETPLEGLWLQARYSILPSIAARAPVSEQKPVNDSQDVAPAITTPTHQLHAAPPSHNTVSFQSLFLRTRFTVHSGTEQPPEELKTAYGLYLSTHH